jgi:hypothetical protein
VRRRSSGGGKRRRRSSSSSHSGGNVQTRIQRTLVGGFVYGLIIKYIGAQLPNIPLLGKSGTVAAAIYFLKPKSQLLQDAGIAAAAIAGNSLGYAGVVQGDDEVIASQT